MIGGARIIPIAGLTAGPCVAIWIQVHEILFFQVVWFDLLLRAALSRWTVVLGRRRGFYSLIVRAGFSFWFLGLAEGSWDVQLAWSG